MNQNLPGTILEAEAREQRHRAEPNRAKRAKRARARMASDAPQGAIPCGIREVPDLFGSMADEAERLRFSLFGRMADETENKFPRGAAGGAVGGAEETHQHIHGERRRDQICLAAWPTKLRTKSAQSCLAAWPTKLRTKSRISPTEFQPGSAAGQRPTGLVQQSPRRELSGRLGDPRGAAGQQIHGERKMVSSGQARKGTGTG
jgi:hypothetical protein